MPPTAGAARTDQGVWDRSGGAPGTSAPVSATPNERGRSELKLRSRVRDSRWDSADRDPFSIFGQNRKRTRPSLSPTLDAAPRADRRGRRRAPYPIAPPAAQFDSLNARADAHLKRSSIEIEGENDKAEHDERMRRLRERSRQPDASAARPPPPLAKPAVSRKKGALASLRGLVRTGQDGPLAPGEFPRTPAGAAAAAATPRPGPRDRHTVDEKTDQRDVPKQGRQRKRKRRQPQSRGSARDPTPPPPLPLDPPANKKDKTPSPVTPPTSAPSRRKPVQGQCLHLYAGLTLSVSDSDPALTLAQCLRLVGWTCIDVDRMNPGSHMDIHDDTTFWYWIHRIRSKDFDYVFINLPTVTFEANTCRQVPGALPLRTWDEPWGIIGMEKSRDDKVREGNMAVLRSIDMAEACMDVGCGFAIANTPPYSEGPSLWDMKQFKVFMKSSKCHTVDLVQCRYGATHDNPVRIAYKGGTFLTLACICDHPKVNWEVRVPDKCSKCVTQAHPPVFGNDEHGKAYERATSAFPEGLNKRIAASIALSKSLVPVGPMQ